MIITCKKFQEGLSRKGHLQPRFYSKARALSTTMCKMASSKKDKQTTKNRNKRSLTSKNEVTRRPNPRYLVGHSAQSSLKLLLTTLVTSGQ